jgi:hypothetical protein
MQYLSSYYNGKKGVGKWLVEHSSKNDLLEGGWKGIYRLVEPVSKCKVGKRGGERVYGLVKAISKNEVGERRWEVVN